MPILPNLVRWADLTIESLYMILYTIIEASKRNSGANLNIIGRFFFPSNIKVCRMVVGPLLIPWMRACCFISLGLIGIPTLF